MASANTLAEIENAIKTIEKEGNYQIILLHCIAIYPPAYEKFYTKLSALTGMSKNEVDMIVMKMININL